MISERLDGNSIGKKNTVILSQRQVQGCRDEGGETGSTAHSSLVHSCMDVTHK